MFVDSGEYEFESENIAQRFINKVLSQAESLYKGEGYLHKYDDFKDFLYTSEVDGIAYFVFEGEYGDY
jgi:hypothetical protein